MLTTKQWLARVAGSFATGFVAVATATTPFAQDFYIVIIQAIWGGFITSLLQIIRWADSYGRKRSN